jgi:hypothetical protein
MMAMTKNLSLVPMKLILLAETNKRMALLPEAMNQRRHFHQQRQSGRELISTCLKQEKKRGHIHFQQHQVPSKTVLELV